MDAFSNRKTSFFWWSIYLSMFFFVTIFFFRFKKSFNMYAHVNVHELHVYQKWNIAKVVFKKVIHRNAIGFNLSPAGTIYL